MTDEVDSSSSAMGATSGASSLVWSSSITVGGSVTCSVLTLAPPPTSGTGTLYLLPKKASDRTKDSSDGIYISTYTYIIYMWVDSNTTVVFQGIDNNYLRCRWVAQTGVHDIPAKLHRNLINDQLNFELLGKC